MDGGSVCVNVLKRKMRKHRNEKHPFTARAAKRRAAIAKALANGPLDLTALAKRVKLGPNTVSVVCRGNPRLFARLNPDVQPTRGNPAVWTLAADPAAKAAGRRLCRHCNRKPHNRPKGLCWTCYYTPGVPDLYPSTSRYAKRGVGGFAGQAKPCEPTTALPGTPEKVAVLEERARLGQELFHPLDAVHDQRDGNAPEPLFFPLDHIAYEDEAA